ncbi:MAG: M48 family metallopeptidase [Clostridiales bacterium]|nr:M48 family metallopeptidase [Clostridiales bacterium]MCF8023078.1 M48 family metallopeptidase [Clostridiales bacterium]
MKLTVKYGTRDIPFEVIYRKRKNMEIRVEPPDKIAVIAPKDTPEQVILDKVKNKGSWIVQKLFEIKDIEYRTRNKEFVNGESFMYLGRNYSLQLYIDESLKKPEVKLYQGKFKVTTPSKDEVIIREAMEKWYRDKALKKIKERVKYYQYYFKVQPTKVRVKEQKRRWGSCTSKNELLFNWRLIMASSPVLDYLVVHEMSHLVHRNHSQDFWDMVASILPDYKNRREWLKKHGVKMEL